MLEALISALLAGLFNFIQNWLKEKRGEQTLKELGAAQERGEFNADTADANRRMAESNAQPRTDDDVLDRLRRGDA